VVRARGAQAEGEGRHVQAEDDRGQAAVGGIAPGLVGGLDAEGPGLASRGASDDGQVAGHRRSVWMWSSG
jgi:hypothetical protein